MARPKVWLMRNYHDPQIEAYLSEHCDVIVRQSNVTPPHEEIVKMAAECDGFLPEGIDIIDAEVARQRLASQDHRRPLGRH